MTTATLPVRAPVGPLLEFDPDRFRADFDRRPFLIRHRLADHPLFALPRLIELARALPEKQVEYNAGDVPVSLDPAQTPRTGLSVEETIRRIEECRSWLVLKFVETDADYRALLNECLDQMADATGLPPEGMTNREAFIFISSPGSVTPYHVDPECNFLLQVRGLKTVHQFDRDDRSLISEEELERFFSGAHRNLDFRDEYQARAKTFLLQPGDGLHFPVAAPHWVKNEDEVSISFSITFRTDTSERRCGAYQVNHALRRWGLRPAPVGVSSWRDGLKYQALRIGRRLGRLIGRPS